MISHLGPNLSQSLAASLGKLLNLTGAELSHLQNGDPILSTSEEGRSLGGQIKFCRINKSPGNAQAWSKCSRNYSSYSSRCVQQWSVEDIWLCFSFHEGAMCSTLSKSELWVPQHLFHGKQRDDFKLLSSPKNTRQNWQSVLCKNPPRNGREGRSHKLGCVYGIRRHSWTNFSA